MVEVAQGWPGVASFSTSVFASREPKNTKFVFASVRAFAFGQLARQLGDVRFIQVGANDGVSGDPLNPFILGGGWTGLLVEPVPAARARLIQTYAGVPGLKFSGEAVWRRSERRPFHMVDGIDVLSSFSLDTILLHEAKYLDLRARIRTVEIDAWSLDELSMRYGVANPDVIAVDAEGCDDIVLEGFDIEARPPALILFEHVALSETASADLRDRLVAMGYTLIADRHDVLAIRQGVFDAPLATFLQDVVNVARSN